MIKSIIKNSRVLFYFKTLIVFILVFFSNAIIAQTVLKQQLLFNESEDLVYSKPNEALKIAMLLLNNSTSIKERAKIDFLIATIYKVKGDYNNALIYLFEADKNPENLENKNAVQILVAKAEILRALYLDDLSKKYLEEAAQKLLLVTDAKEKEFLTSQIIVEKITANLDRQNYKEGVQLIQKHASELVNLDKNPELNLLFFIAKGKMHCGLGDFEKGNYYFNQASFFLINNTNKYAEAYNLNGLATVYFHKKEYKKAISALSKALEIAQTFENLYVSETTSRLLIFNYIALNDNTNYKLFNTKFLTTNMQLEGTEQEAINTAYNLINKEYESYYSAKNKDYSTKFYIVLVLFFVVLIFCFLFWYRFQLKKKRLKEIINYLEVTRNNLINRYTEKKEVNKKIFIPQETEQALLNKLKRFESSARFTNNDMSLAVLSGQFETNTKYLSEIINKHYHVNFNTYINKLRINFIVEKLKSDPNFINYKISYLAETSGFSSHSTFATIFKSITGIAPITFIEFLKKEREMSNV